VPLLLCCAVLLTLCCCPQGAYRPHQLKAADITCGSLTELSVINLRRMFANMGQEFMDLQKQQARKNDDDDNNGQRRRRIANAML
jgi:hypothetical protein